MFTCTKPKIFVYQRLVVFKFQNIMRLFRSENQFWSLRNWKRRRRIESLKRFGCQRWKFRMFMKNLRKLKACSLIRKFVLRSLLKVKEKRKCSMVGSVRCLIIFMFQIRRKYQNFLNIKKRFLILINVFLQSNRCA